MIGPACAARSCAPNSLPSAEQDNTEESPSSIDLLGNEIGCLRHRYLIRQCSEMRSARHKGEHRENNCKKLDKSHSHRFGPPSTNRPQVVNNFAFRSVAQIRSPGTRGGRRTRL